MRGFLGTLLLVAALLLPGHSSHAATEPFPVWLKALRQEALQYGISQKTIDAALPDTLAPDERVLRYDRKQPENTVTFERYKKNVITPARLREGRRYMHQYKSLLKAISDVYGVEPQYIVALWGMETSFGKNTGGFETIPALVTLAYDGRRNEFFRQELLKALRIVDQGHIALHEMKGSWAGAMGQNQFMPSSFELFSQDYNKDGKRDIWKNTEDVLASIGAYLSMSGWQKGQPLLRVVKIPKDFDNKLLTVNIQKPLQDWIDAGIRPADRKKSSADFCELLSVIQPGGAGYKAYLVYGNYRIIMKWNFSSYFATAVAHFADQLK